MKVEGIPEEIVNRMRADKFASIIGIKLEEIAPGRAKASLRITDLHLNGVQIIQGGVLFTLADYVFAAAANSRGNVSVVTDANITFIKGISSGTVYAEAREISCKRTLSRYTVNITSESGELLAVYNGTAFRKS